MEKLFINNLLGETAVILIGSLASSACVPRFVRFNPVVFNSVSIPSTSKSAFVLYRVDNLEWIAQLRRLQFL